MSNGKIGKFKKLKRLGSGSSGSVWLCESKSGEHVAVKLLEQSLMQNENSLILDMFSNEIEISEKLSHPNIVKIQGHHISDDSVFIVMEYIDGGALDQFDSPDALLSFEQLIAYAIPSCKALEFAASQGFIHCDIKPSNIFLSQDGTVKVSDFGAGLQMAADLVGATMNHFVVQAALEKADKVIESESTIVLTRRESLLLLELIENPPPMNAKLKKLMADYEKSRCLNRSR